jgi:O-antigen ligase
MMKWLPQANLYERLSFLSVAGIVFFLPVFGRLVPVLIILMVLNWLLLGNPLTHFSRLIREPFRLKMISFSALYLLYIVGLFYSRNRDFAWFDLETKLSLLIFPLIFAGSAIPMFEAGRLKMLLNIFIAGCGVGATILLIHAGLNKFSYKIADSFYYTRLAWYFHSTYLAMYYNFACIICFLLFMNSGKMRRWFRLIYLLFGTFFIIMIFLLSSKAGILALATIFAALLVLTWKAGRNLKSAVTLGIYGILMMMAGVVLTPSTWVRFSTVGQAVRDESKTVRTAPESNADRLAVWGVAIDIINDNPLWGVGTGDVKDELVKGYTRVKAIPAIEKKYNAHSQYLQTFAALGIPGFSALLLMLGLPLWFALRKKYFLYFLFLVVIAINALTESILEVQAGVVFYSFFNMLLFSSGKTEGPGFPEPI